MEGDWNMEQRREASTTTKTMMGMDALNAWTSETLNLLMDRIEQKGSPVPGMVPNGVSMTRLNDEIYTVNIRFHKGAKA